MVDLSLVVGWLVGWYNVGSMLDISNLSIFICMCGTTHNITSTRDHGEHVHQHGNVHCSNIPQNQYTRVHVESVNNITLCYM